MPCKNIITSILLFIAITFTANSQGNEVIVYKTIDTVSLEMEIIYPENYKKKSDLTAMVFFFGGGWVGGTRNQFRPHAEYYAAKGVVCFLVDYRVRNKHKTPPSESLKDAKSAMRYIRSKADQFHIDPNKIIGAGGSAGGHLAAATAIIEGYNEDDEDTSISCVPNALVLFNPVIDNGPAGYGYERVGEEYKSFSPIHNIRPNLPPTIFFLGTKDNLIPVETGEYFKKSMERTKNVCELYLYEDKGHGFFNVQFKEEYWDTINKTDAFLQNQKLIK